jgi:hypothetical protein
MLSSKIERLVVEVGGHTKDSILAAHNDHTGSHRLTASARESLERSVFPVASAVRPVPYANFHPSRLGFDLNAHAVSHQFLFDYLRQEVKARLCSLEVCLYLWLNSPAIGRLYLEPVPSPSDEEPLIFDIEEDGSGIRWLKTVIFKPSWLWPNRKDLILGLPAA